MRIVNGRKSLFEYKQVSLRCEPRSHVARDRYDLQVDGNSDERRHEWLGPPHVDKSFPLEHVDEPQTYMEERKNTDKVVLTT